MDDWLFSQGSSEYPIDLDEITCPKRRFKTAKEKESCKRLEELEKRRTLPTLHRSYE